MKERLSGIVSHASHKGMRKYQEDRWVVQDVEVRPNGALSLLGFFMRKHFWVLAVCDGHGGEKVADVVGKNLIHSFEEASRRHKKDIRESLRDTVRQLHELTKAMLSGTTLSLVVISDSGMRADVAILGDSPVIICDATQSIWICPEHNARTNVSERDAAIARGAYYYDGYLGITPSVRPGLQVSRTLGDAGLDKILNREPELFTVPLGRESFILVGSDGLLDPAHLSSQREMRHVVELIRGGAKAEELVGDALGRKTEDNVSAVLWRAVGR